MSRRTLIGNIVYGLIVMALQSVPAAAATPNLTGSWQFTLTPASTTTPPVVVIPGLATFTTDGSVVETDGSEFAPGPLSTSPIAMPATPGHGIWQMANTPETLFVQYISLVLESDGSLHARNITTMFLTMNSKGNQFTGTYATDQVTGTVATLVSSGKVSGQLIPHIPLP